MNLQIFMRVNNFIKITIVAILTLATTTALADWKIDFSRRQPEVKKEDLRAPQPSKAQKGFFGKLFHAEAPATDVVILSTEKGFVPKTLRLRKGVKYKVHVVNVNAAEKNISFMMDEFAQHHSTYYGQIRSFEIHPQKEGVFSFISPETALEGQVVVLQTEPKMIKAQKSALRFPASQN